MKRDIINFYNIVQYFHLQIMIHDENGECLDTANNLRAKFEALQMQDTAKAAAKEAAQKFRVKRFKVNITFFLSLLFALFISFFLSL